jgi:uncharacterized protein YdiU (UPF0061 family)
VSTLDSLAFDNTYARLPAPFHTRLDPTPLPDPYLVSFNASAAELIGLDPAEAARPEFLAVVAGNRVPAGAEPIAALYAGHQFGQYVPQLGDGRAILLGEVVNGRGERWDLQLKGAGRTPYSRFGDGRAVLRSTIREYLCSEAMHALGIPTTRALAIAGSDQPVLREARETAAVLLRLAPTHVRFGSFEIFHYRHQPEHLRTLADYVIGLHYPEFAGSDERDFLFLEAVAQRTGRLIAQWQAVGFAHGVMNTDNMSVLGVTLDYGPFGFVEAYDPGFICNHSDDFGRYAFGQQPHVGLWNVACLAQALTSLLPRERCEEALAAYEPAFLDEYSGRMRAKLGLAQARDEDAALVTDLLGVLAANRVDYTNFFRDLAGVTRHPGSEAALAERFTGRSAFATWVDRYRARLAAEESTDEQRAAGMNRANPRYVLRNWLAHEAIRKATEERDYSEIDRLLTLLSRPFDEQPGMEACAASAPEWASGLTVSCSS